jgi:putative tryptophan/tyrosine transport system substrate-binding protein
MRRRAFIAGLGSAGAWPVVARGQQPAMPVIGFLGAGTVSAYASYVDAFRRGLTAAGSVEGHDVAVEFRWLDGRYDQAPALAAELVDKHVAIIVATGGTAVALAAKTATTTTPIVFVIGADPIKFGLVASLNRPGGNVTGVSFLINLLTAKQFEVLHELIPKTADIGFLVNPVNPNAETDTREVRFAADRLGRKLIVAGASTAAEIDIAFATLVKQGASAVVIGADALFVSRQDQIVELAMRHTMPTIYNSREYVTAGGLMSYGPNQAEAYQQAGVYASRILKGEKPANLPVVQPTKFELVINLKTAKTLGLTIPPSLLARADEVIE